MHIGQDDVLEFEARARIGEKWDLSVRLADLKFSEHIFPHAHLLSHCLPVQIEEFVCDDSEITGTSVH